MADSSWTPPPAPDPAKLCWAGLEAWERDQPKVIAFDTETFGLAYHDKAFGASIAWYSPAEDALRGGPIGVEGHWFELDEFDASDVVNSILTYADVIVGHNLKFDLHRLDVSGVYDPDEWGDTDFHDTEAMAHLIDEHQKKGLKDLAVKYLGIKDTVQVKVKATGEFKTVPREAHEMKLAKEWTKKEHGLKAIADVSFDMLPRGVTVPYAIKDAEFTFSLARILHPQVLALAPELYASEMELATGALYSLERAGMAIREDYVGGEIKRLRTACLQHELAIEQIVGKPVRTGHIPPKERDQFFNPASNPELATYFTAAGETHDSYDADTLRVMRHPLAGKLLEYRKDKKLLETYFTALQDETVDGVFHPSIRQHGTVTGRASSGKERGDSY